MKIGFLIICPECNPGGLRYTTSCLRHDFDDAEQLAMVGGAAKDENVKEMSKFCRVAKGSDTISSLVDVGIENVKSDWVFILRCGARLKLSTFKTYRWFLRDDKDILFSATGRKMYFDEATINGTLINRDFFNQVGSLGAGDCLQDVKLAWADRAIGAGATFKAIVGVRL